MTNLGSLKQTSSSISSSASSAPPPPPHPSAPFFQINSNTTLISRRSVPLSLYPSLSSFSVFLSYDVTHMPKHRNTKTPKHRNADTVVLDSRLHRRRLLRPGTDRLCRAPMRHGGAHHIADHIVRLLRELCVADREHQVLWGLRGSPGPRRLCDHDAMAPRRCCHAPSVLPVLREKTQDGA